MDVNQISLRDGIIKSGKDDFIAQLHKETPLYKDASGFWVASKFEDVRTILLDHARFSSSAMASSIEAEYADDPLVRIFRSKLSAGIAKLCRKTGLAMNYRGHQFGV